MEFSRDKFISSDFNSKSRVTTFTYKCLTEDCKNNFKIQGNKFHSGKCRSCSQKKRPYEYILSELLHRSKKYKNMFILLSYEDLLELINNPYCHYCNKKLDYYKHTRSDNGKPTTRAYQLDRKDNNLGYFKENLVTCCWECNRIKSDKFTYDEFLFLSKTLITIYNKRNIFNNKLDIK